MIMYDDYKKQFIYMFLCMFITHVCIKYIYTQDKGTKKKSFTYFIN